MTRKLGCVPADITFDNELGIRFDIGEDYWGSLNIKQAQELALNILTRWPIEKGSEDENAAHTMLRVEAFIAAMIERLPLPVVARIIESIATNPEPHLRGTITVTAWCHPGACALIADLAARLLDITRENKVKEP